MELLIVSGLSGAGKSVAMNALEDIGYFCIDNVPAGLLPSITAFSKAGDNQLERVALSMDVRGCRSREQIEAALKQLDEQKTPYKILFLDAPDEVLMRRYNITTRNDNDRILVFPFYDEQNILRFVKYRNTDFVKGRDKAKEWCEHDTMPILFGMAQCEDFTRLVITEGQIFQICVLYL